MISQTLELIKEHTGLDLPLCGFFTGVRERNGDKFFNVILKERIYMSLEYEQLERFANKYKLIRVAPNGVHRVAIYPNSLLIH